MGLSLIEGSCPEIGVLQPLDPQDGTPTRQRLSTSWLARPAPLAQFRAQRAPARAGSFNVEGSGCRPSRTMPRVLGPASGSLQGRNPREAALWRCRDRYGYLDIWSLAGEVVIAPAGLVFGERRSGNSSRWCDCE